MAANLLGDLSKVQEAAFGNVDNVPVGIVSGIVASAMYNRFSKTELP